MNARRTIHLTTCVWGLWHLDVMERVMWPTLLSPNNLPALVRNFNAVYRVATTPEDHARITAWPIYRRLADVVRVEFVTNQSSPDVSYHISWYNQAIQQARSADALCFFVPPDVAWSDGTFGHAAKVIQGGKLGISIPYLRVISETCFPEVADLLAAEGTIAAPDLVRLAIRHLHPLTATVLVSGRHARPSLEALWRVPGEGILLRHMIRELSVFDPNMMDLTSGWNASRCSVTDLHIVEDSDDMLMLSFAPLMKDLDRIGIYIPEHSVKPMDLARMSLHPLNDTPLINEFARRPVRVHHREVTPKLWRPFERRGDAFMKQVLFMREFLRIWSSVKGRGYQRASQLMSAALQGTRLPSRWKYDGPITAFIPNDAALRSLQYTIDELVDEKSTSCLITTVLNHVCAGRIVLPGVGETVLADTLGGAPLRLDARGSGICINNSANIVDEIETAPHRVFIIDKWIASTVRKG